MSESVRIKPLDGLRVIAAFGVVWIHTWTFLGNPSLKVGPVDFYRVIAVLGNRVDFFFVISGFFMFLALAKKEFNWTNYKNFILKRWERIAPAFYVCALIYAGIFFIKDSNYPFFQKIIINTLFVNNFWPGSEIIGPFWSLSTEWHFYIILPFLFINNTRKFFIRRLVIASLISILFLLLINKNLLNEDFWEKQVCTRFIEFSWGILAAYCYTNKVSYPKIISGWKGIVLAFLLTYSGRVLMVTEVVSKLGKVGWFFNALSLPIMTFGFALLCYLLISERSILSKILSFPIMQYLGKISFSIYLWHSLVILILTTPLQISIKYTGGVPIAFLMVSACTIGISYISYTFLEEPYFKKHQQIMQK